MLGDADTRDNVELLQLNAAEEEGEEGDAVGPDSLGDEEEVQTHGSGHLSHDQVVGDHLAGDEGPVKTGGDCSNL